MELDGRKDAAVLLVQALRPLVDRERGARRADRMVRRAPVRLEDHHETVAGGLVHVAVLALDDLEEAREVCLDELVELLRVELLGELRIARDVEEEHRDLDGLLLQLGRVRVLLEEALHRLRDELRQLALELLEELEALAGLLEVPQGALELDVLRREVLVRLSQA